MNVVLFVIIVFFGVNIVLEIINIILFNFVLNKMCDWFIFKCLLIVVFNVGDFVLG